MARLVFAIMLSTVPAILNAQPIVDAHTGEIYAWPLPRVYDPYREDRLTAVETDGRLVLKVLSSSRRKTFALELSVHR
jgi:hypothetical protein